MPDRSPTILLVDDHDLFRSGLRMILESAPQAQIKVFEASNGESCIQLIRRNSIDVVFMDYSLPGLDGVSTSLRLLQIDEALKIIILTGLEDRPVSRVVLQAGIRGYMTKASATEEIEQAIHCVMQGGTYLSREVANQMALDSLKQGDGKHPLGELSRRELQVALLLMSGHKSGVVGSMLFLSPKSVSTYKRRAFEKLKVNTLAELIDIGRESGFLAGDQVLKQTGKA